MKQEALQMLKFINKKPKKTKATIELLTKIVKKNIGNQKCGKKRANLQLIIGGILYYMRTGCTWRLVPAVFGNYKTIYGWFARISKLELFKKIWNHLKNFLYGSKKKSLRKILIDGSLTCFSGEKTYAKRNPRNRNKLTINRIISTNGSGIPIDLIIVPGTAHDTNFLQPMLNKIDEKHTLKNNFYVHADKGFDSFKNRRFVSSKGGFPEISLRKMGFQIEFHNPKDRYRWKVERSIAWLNRFQSIAHVTTRLVSRFSELFHLAFIIIGSRKLALKDFSFISRSF